MILRDSAPSPLLVRPDPLQSMRRLDNTNVATLPRQRIILPRPLPSKVPIPKRRPESAKYMTIIFGILESDRIIFAADTEETGQFMKISTPKLHSYSRDNGECLVIGGAGSVPPVEALQQRLGKTFMDDSDSFEEVAEVIIKQFYDEHVANQQDLDFWLIVGGSFKSGEHQYNHRLWVAERGIMRDSDGIAVIGIGKDVARTLLKKSLVRSHFPISELSSVHIIQLVKSQAQYCGMESMIWSLSGPDVFKMSIKHIQRAEELSRRYDELNKNVFSALFATEASLPYIDSKLRTLQSDYANVMNAIRSEYVTEKRISEHFRDNPEDR
ncbi:MAG: hypothetical protein WAN35_12215 [Terracidiphilus sp.]